VKSPVKRPITCTRCRAQLAAIVKIRAGEGGDRWFLDVLKLCEHVDAAGLSRWYHTTHAERGTLRLPLTLER
jgi:hypothetical protein